MKKKLLYISLILLFLSLQSCDDIRLLPSITGPPYEVMVVMEDRDWNSEAGRTLFEMLSANTPGIPQAENMFSIVRIRPQDFTRSLQFARNIIIVNISEIYSRTRISARRDIWARPQIVVTINSPDEEQFVDALLEHHESITGFILQREFDRQINYFRRHHNHNVTNKIRELFDVEMRVPSFIARYTYSIDDSITFFWASNMSLDARMDIVIYSYAYTDPNTFTKDFLVQKRDDVLRRIPGPTPGSHMATEIIHFPPIFRAITKNGRFCAEVRGWWRVEGDLMGGPFISHTQLDEISGRIITIEGFVFAPGIPKRNHIRRLEAVIHSALLPQDLIEEQEN